MSSKSATKKLVVLSVLIRLTYLGFPEIIPEEAYYWLYSVKLDWSYLDHPPMTAWLIRLGVVLFGQCEFAVRAGAMLSWAGGAFFVFLLAKRIFSKEIARYALLLYSWLPFFFGIGFTMAPDSPLVLFWAAGIYFTYNALIDGKQGSWYLVGLCVGLGMLSKYTMVLLALSTIAFCIIHKPSRVTFFKKEPYLAALIAILVFFPVLYWNYQHDWASFMFQGPRRFEKEALFSLHLFILDLLVLVTPFGFAALLILLWQSVWRRSLQLRTLLPGDQAKARFIQVFLYVPLVVFALYSLWHTAKLNWSGPAFLVFLPSLGSFLYNHLEQGVPRPLRLVQKSWNPILCILILVAWVGLHYLSFGIPGVPYSSNMLRFVGWKDLGKKVLDIQKEVASAETAPIIVGMDKHYAASELAFYTKYWALREGRSAPVVIGRCLFNPDCLMFKYWDAGRDVDGKDMILAARRDGDLAESLLEPFFDSLSPVEEITLSRNGRPVGEYLYRVGKGFRGEVSTFPVN